MQKQRMQKLSFIIYAYTLYTTKFLPVSINADKLETNVKTATALFPKRPQSSEALHKTLKLDNIRFSRLLNHQYIN